ncbi:MAG TPA: ATP-binding protein [bacterium]|nr:ATP-binding protein [bacterium]
MIDSPATSILIVEDEAIVALDLRYRMEAFGYSICGIAATGDDAISLARSTHPDIVFMDIQLKGAMDGIEAAERIGVESGIPIVFVTAFTDEATLLRVKSAAPYGYIIKPYDEREIRIVLELAIAKFRYAHGLQRAKEAAEASDRAKTCFLSNISHELKTPLNVIMGCIDLAGGDVSEEERREYLSLADRGVRRLQTLIDTILDYTKVELGALAPRVQEFELGEFLSSCWQPFAFDAHAKGLDPRLELDPALPASMNGDPERLSTLVRNLLDNAIKFTDAGFVCLSAERLQVSDSHAQLRLAVTDTGKGIPEEQRARLFEAFRQGDDSITRATGGLGLGLSLARALANLMGIRLEYSVPELGGSAFSLYIPIPADAPPAFSRHTGTNNLVGLFGAIALNNEFQRWSEHLGLRMMPVDETRDSDGDPLVILATESAWLEANPAQREAVTAGGLRPLILIGGPYAVHSLDGRDGETIRLPYPSSLANFAKALDNVLSGRGSSAVTGAAEIHRHQPVEPRKPARDYGLLVSRATAEANGMGLKESLQELLILMHGQSHTEDASALERHIKDQYNRYTNCGAVACARLALAYAMDIRNSADRGSAEPRATTGRK